MGLADRRLWGIVAVRTDPPLEAPSGLPGGPPGKVSRNLTRAASGTASGRCLGPTAVCGVVKRFCRALVVLRDWWGAIRPVPSPLTRRRSLGGQRAACGSTAVVVVRTAAPTVPVGWPASGYGWVRGWSGGRGVGARET